MKRFIGVYFVKQRYDLSAKLLYKFSTLRSLEVEFYLSIMCPAASKGGAVSWRFQVSFLLLLSNL